MSRITKVISGGQTGVDQAALRAARATGLEIGGWCPPGRECETGVIPAEFPLKETERERSPGAPAVPRSQRTEWNVRDSDGVLVIQATVTSRASETVREPADHAAKEGADSGTEWAMRCAKRFGRPLLVCDVSDPGAKEKIRQWLERFSIIVLSVGGPAESTCPGIGERAYRLLCAVFEL
jgi:hypothetical protein